MNYVASGYVHTGYFRRDSDVSGDFTFDGVGRFIFVNSGVTSIDMPDMYARWVDWSTREDNLKWSPAVRFSGYDPIPGGFTGATFFLQNGWRLVYDANTVAVRGVLYSEDFPTPFMSPSGDPIYPATVAALVNSSVSYQNVVTGTALTPEETAQAVWTAAQRTLTASLDPNTAQIVAAVVAALQATRLPVDAVKMNGADIIGDGSEADPWRGAGVSP